MIEDNQEHGQTTEEYGERVEVVVGYHILRGGLFLGEIVDEAQEEETIWFGIWKTTLESGCDGAGGLVG